MEGGVRGVCKPQNRTEKRKKPYYRDEIDKKTETAISHFDDTVIKRLARSSIDLEVISLYTYSEKVYVGIPTISFQITILLT